MNFSRIFFFVFAYIMALATVSAAPAPGNFFKDIERAGQRIRDAVISAGPAVAVAAQATALAKGK